MQIKCQHGYFKFNEFKAGEISDFINLFGFELINAGDYYTFEKLLDAPKYSLIGAPYLGVPAIKTFEGDPWDVMAENDLVYDFTKNIVVPMKTITQVMQLSQTARYFLSTGMILPGSITDDGSRVTDYTAFFLFGSMKFKYGEVSFE